MQTSTKSLPRGVLPTYVTNEVVVLSKVAPTLRNTYEIRLALYMAKSNGLRFVLSLRPGAQIEASVLVLLREHGGTIEEAELSEYSVYFGRARHEGEEEGWVLGDAAAFSALKASVKSPWLQEHMRVGAAFSGANLELFEDALRKERISAKNIDEENVHAALLSLSDAARRDGGIVFIQ